MSKQVLIYIGRLWSYIPPLRLHQFNTDWRKQYHDQTELMNTHWESSPSRIISKALGNIYHYNQPKMAVMTTSTIGIDSQRNDCPHFNPWIEQLTHLNI